MPEKAAGWPQEPTESRPEGFWPPGRPRADFGPSWAAPPALYIRAQGAAGAAGTSGQWLLRELPSSPATGRPYACTWKEYTFTDRG
jgi:hypothetical protein